MVDALTQDNTSPSPSAFVDYFAAVDVYASGDMKAARNAICKFVSSRPSKDADGSAGDQRMRLGYHFPGIGDAVMRALALVPAHGRTASTPITVVELITSQKASLNAAFDLLSQLWPEASSEVKSSVAVINGFVSDRVIGFCQWLAAAERDPEHEQIVQMRALVGEMPSAALSTTVARVGATLAEYSLYALLATHYTDLVGKQLIVAGSIAGTRMQIDRHPKCPVCSDVADPEWAPYA